MLERFKKSDLKDPDGEVRAAALLALDPTDDAFREALVNDRDDAVRARLLAPVTDVVTLEARRHDDASAKVRDAAAARLRQVLTDPELTDATRAEAYIDACADADMLFHLALHSGAAQTRGKAASRHAAVAAEPVEHQLLQLAMASRDADDALKRAAQDAIDDLDVLETLVQLTRKSDKVSHRFARERQKALREQAMASEKLAALAEDLSKRAAEPVEANSDALHQAVARQQQWEQRFAAAAAAANADAPDVSEALARVTAAIETARAAVAGRERIIAQVQAQEGSLDEAALRAQWAALPGPSPRETELFEQGVIAWVTLEKKMAAAGSAWEAGRALLEAAEADGATTQLRSFTAAWAALKLAEPADDEQRALVARYQARVDALTEDEKRAQAARDRAVEQANALLEKLRTSLEEGQISAATSACDRLAHRLRVRENLAGDALARLEKGLAELSPRLAELKQARIWSTQQARQELIAEVESLALQAEDTSPKALATRIRALRGKWRELDHGIGPAHQDIWSRFDKACKAAYAPAKKHFDAESEQRKANKAKRVAICEQLTRLEADTNWDAPDYKALEKAIAAARRAWREAGPVNHRDMKPLRKRYDTALEALEKHIGPERDRELRRRELAIKSLENCIASEPMPTQIELAKKIQAEWAPTVRARRREEQKLWDTLRKLCDSVFAKRNEQSESRRAAQDEVVVAREGLLDELARLRDDASAAADEAQMKALTAAYGSIRERWRDAGDVHPKKRSALQKRYRDLCKGIDNLQKDARRKAGARKDQAMLEVVKQVDARWRTLAAGGDAEALQVDGVAGPLGKALVAAGSAAPRTDDGAARAALCLRAELDADIESPPEFSAQRMQLKVERLNAAMAGDTPPPPRERVSQLVEAWLATPLAGNDTDTTTWSRFEAALDALVHRR